MRKNKIMDKIELTREEVTKIVRDAYVHGFGNAQMLEAGLEKDETMEYIAFAVHHIFKAKQVAKL